MALDAASQRARIAAPAQQFSGARHKGLPVTDGGACSRAVRSHGLAFIICLAAAFVFTWPGSLSLNSGLLGFPGDNFQHAWFLWHFARALLHGHNPFYTRLMFYPTRVNLAWSTTDPLAGFLALPLSVFAGPVVAYNLSLILQLALAAFCARLLCLRVTRNEVGALIGGLIFGFSPYLMAHALEHLSLVTAFPIPLFVLALDRLFANESPSWTMGIPLGIALLLSALAHYNYTVICIVFAALFLVIEIWRNRRIGMARFLGRIFRPIAAGAATFSIGFSPLLWMMLGTRGEIPAPRHPGHIEVMSADALGFAIPSWNHVFFGKFVREMNPDMFRAGVEGTVYVGAIVLALAAIGLWTRRKTNRLWAVRAAILGVVFWILSLGPRVHTLGHEMSFPAPAELFFDLPFAKFVSAPARFDVIIELCLAILASLAMKFLLESRSTRAHRYWTISLIVALVLADYLTIPFPRASTFDPGKGYYFGQPQRTSIACSPPRDLQHGTILTFPLVDSPYCLKSMWMQVTDRGAFAIVDGYLSYSPPDVWKPFWNIRILRSLMTIQGIYHAPINMVADAASAPATVRDLNLSAAIVFNSPERDAAVSYIEKVFGTKPERAGSCTIFRLQPSKTSNGELGRESR
jgi:hypothetical protein